MGGIARVIDTEAERQLQAYAAVLELVRLMHNLLYDPDVFDRLDTQIKASYSLTEKEQAARDDADSLIKASELAAKTAAQAQEKLAAQSREHKALVEEAEYELNLDKAAIEVDHAGKLAHIADQNETLAQREADVEAREKALFAIAAELDEKQTALDEREEAVAAREQIVEDTRRKLGG